MASKFIPQIPAKAVQMAKILAQAARRLVISLSSMVTMDRLTWMAVAMVSRMESIEPLMRASRAYSDSVRFAVKYRSRSIGSFSGPTMDTSSEIRTVPNSGMPIPMSQRPKAVSVSASGTRVAATKAASRVAGPNGSAASDAANEMAFIRCICAS